MILPPMVSVLWSDKTEIRQNCPNKKGVSYQSKTSLKLKPKLLSKWNKNLNTQREKEREREMTL